MASSAGLDNMFRHVELPTANPASILLIELDADTAEMYDVGLSVEGFRPYVATDEEQTIRMLRTHRPEAVVVDLGSRAVVWNLIDAVRMEESTRALPLVLLAECVDPRTIRRAAALGCAALLVKPCVPDLLASVLRQVAAPSLDEARMTPRLRNESTERRKQARGGVTEPSRAQLVTMVIGTFREMPGLSLHLNQAARLFGVRAETCRLLLDDLVAQGRLRRAHDGQYLGAELGFVVPKAFPGPSPRFLRKS